MQNTHLGYDRENLVYIRIEGELIKMNDYLSFKDQASRMPGIALVDRSSEAPHAMGFVVADDINWEGKQKNQSIGFKPASVGYDFVRLMNLEIAEGRDFSPLKALDSSDAFMVNEEAVRQMGMQHPIGKWISAWKKRGHIICVLKDYHTHSLHEPIKPLILDVKEYEDFGVIIVRTRPGQTKQALASLATVYKNVNPEYPFAYQFVDRPLSRPLGRNRATAAADHRGSRDPYGLHIKNIFRQAKLYFYRYPFSRRSPHRMRSLVKMEIFFSYDKSYLSPLSVL